MKPQRRAARWYGGGPNRDAREQCAKMRAMKKAALITGPLPSMDEVARDLGLSPARRRQLDELIAEVLSPGTRDVAYKKKADLREAKLRRSAPPARRRN